MDEKELEIFKVNVVETLGNIASKITKDELKVLNCIINSFNEVCCKNAQLERSLSELKEWIDSVCFYDNDTITYEQISDKIAELENKDDLD